MTTWHRAPCFAAGRSFHTANKVVRRQVRGYRQGIAAAGAVSAVLVAPAATALADAGAVGACTIDGGFKTLREQIGTDVVGECLAPPHAAEGGDVQQPTSGGLLVWAKATNLVAFTDGSKTWVSGPDGVRTRPNDERFPWEQPQAASPQAKPRATTVAKETLAHVAQVYVERVRGNVDVPLENIYAVGLRLMREQFSAWSAEQRERAGEWLAAARLQAGQTAQTLPARLASMMG